MAVPSALFLKISVMRVLWLFLVSRALNGLLFGCAADARCDGDELKNLCQKSIFVRGHPVAEYYFCSAVFVKQFFGDLFCKNYPPNFIAAKPKYYPRLLPSCAKKSKRKNFLKTKP